MKHLAVRGPQNNSILLALHAILYFSPRCYPFLIAPSQANFFKSNNVVVQHSSSGSSTTFLGGKDGDYHTHPTSPVRFHGGSSRLHSAVSDNKKDTEDLGSLSVTELKKLLSDRGIDFRDCLEKRELVERLRENPGTTGRTSSPSLGLTEAEQARIDMFKRVSPCVANIKTLQLVPDQRGLQLKSLEVPTGSGSGFLWDDQGHVVTNFHVVAAGGRKTAQGMSLPSTVKVKLAGMADAVDAKIVGVEPEKDLAVVKILGPTAQLPSPIAVGTSNDLQVGQSVTAIGNPFGLDDTLTTGIVSALGRDVDGVGGRPIHGCIQTDAAINPGNSGGPLLDSSGRLIGVNTAIFSPNGAGNVGIGFAIPVDTVRRVVNQLIQFGKVVRPTLGLSVVEDRLVRSIESQIGRSLPGCLVADVSPQGPATGVVEASVMNDYGSIVLGDLITKIDDRTVPQAEDLISAVEEKQSGDMVTLELWRKCDPQRVRRIQVRLTTRDQLETRQQRRDNYRTNRSMVRPSSNTRRFMPW